MIKENLVLNYMKIKVEELLGSNAGKQYLKNTLMCKIKVKY